ncbi:hypothetical protein MRB53_039862 [Persea americana]|nr:hypothetical protein MRB53_039862 [Persea americana]
MLDQGRLCTLEYHLSKDALKKVSKQSTKKRKSSWLHWKRNLSRLIGMRRDSRNWSRLKLYFEMSWFVLELFMRMMIEIIGKAKDVSSYLYKYSPLNRYMLISRAGDYAISSIHNVVEMHCANATKHAVITFLIFVFDHQSHFLTLASLAFATIVSRQKNRLLEL